MQKLFKSGSLAAFILLPTCVMAETTTELDDVNVIEQSTDTLNEHKQSLTTSAMQTTTGLVLSPKETPQSVSVVTKSHLDRRSISNLEEAMKTTTGVNVITDAGYYRFQSRGFYIDQIEEDGIASTVRGSNANTFRDPQSMTDLAVFDHIEVVRGATGLTQANGEPGGTINMVRKRPTNEFQAGGNILADTHGKVRNTVDISGTIRAGVRGRFVSASENDPTDKDLPKDNRKGVIYGVMDTEVGSSNLLTLGMLYQNNHTMPNVYGVPMGKNGAEAGLARDTYLGFDWNREKSRKFTTFAEFDIFFSDDWKLTHKLNYTRSNNTDQFGFIANASTRYTGLVAGDTVATNNLQRYDNEGKQISYQANLTGKYRFQRRSHDLFIGYSYSREKNDTRWRRVRNSTPYDPFNFNRNEISEPHWNIAAGASGEAGYDDQTFYDRKLYSHAISFGTRFNLTDSLHLLIGSRYTHWKRIGNEYYDWWNNRSDSDPDEHSHLKRVRWIPYAGLTLDLDKHNSLYMSYTSIFKPNSQTNREGAVLKPTLGNNGEIGWKGEYYDGKLNTSIALFQINQKNRPIYVDDATARGGGYHENHGEVRSRGIDMEISGHLTDDLQLFAGYTFNRSKYLATESRTYYEGENYSKHTPKHIFRLYAEYVLPFDERKWSIGGGVNAQTETESLYGVKQGGFALWDANIRYQVTRNIAVSLIGKNLTNKRYYENNRVRTLGINNFYGQERTGILNIDWKF